MLRYIADESWGSLPLTDFRARFFIETYCEKLRIYTPHFYQARLMNIFSACQEMMTYIEEQYASDRNFAYITSSMEEIEHCWERDPVAQELLADVSEPHRILWRHQHLREWCHEQEAKQVFP